MNLQAVDIRLVLGRLRPGSAYHWRGSGATGNDYSAIGDWLDAATTKPTPAEILAEWGVVQQERADEQARRQARQQKLLNARRDWQGDDLDPSGYQGSPSLLALAQKIAWLEQEIQELRGL